MVLLCRFTQGGGATMPVTQLSGTAGGGGGRQDRRVTLSQIEDEGLGMQGQAEWVHVSHSRLALP